MTPTEYLQKVAKEKDDLVGGKHRMLLVALVDAEGVVSSTAALIEHTEPAAYHHLVDRMLIQPSHGTPSV